MKKENKLFEKHAKQGENMDALEALQLITVAYMKSCEFSIGMRTTIYSAGEIWLYDRLPKQSNNPFPKELITKPLVNLMPQLCKEFDPDNHGTYNICGFNSPEDLKVYMLIAIKEHLYDDATMNACCWAIKQIPQLYEKWMDEELYPWASLRPFIHGEFHPSLEF